jgi:hypothetical protein
VASSAAEEQENMAGCDIFYERCGNWLRENTRDTKKFKILFDENVTYGFRRNLFGLKYVTLVIDALIIVGCGIAFWQGARFDISDTMGGKLILIGAFAIVHAAYVLLVVTEGSVRVAAEQYARQLLLCCESLATGAAPKKARAKS